MVIVPLASHHKRDAFDCGEPSLNDFLRRSAGQYTRNDFGRTYVAVAADGDDHILGYYTVAVSSIPLDQLPQNLPRHSAPVVHPGRLATEASAQGRGVGRTLLVHALKISNIVSDLVGVHAVEVVALHEAASKYYKRFGFRAMPDQPLHMYLTLKEIRKLDL